MEKGDPSQRETLQERRRGKEEGRRERRAWLKIAHGRECPTDYESDMRRRRRKSPLTLGIADCFFFFFLIFVVIDMYTLAWFLGLLIILGSIHASFTSPTHKEIYHIYIFIILSYSPYTAGLSSPVESPRKRGKACFFFG
mmetsp:Transcript_25564/g.47667  ORF Transcript_25564/g.47667 Transcript_25564/m.47667 type:complete len:140 (+) Transcript_25564:415-834(+)